jgi:uncharacterized membrane protein YkvA (DUF1232 family)
MKESPMQGFVEVIKLLIMVGGAIMIVFLVMLGLPQSKLKDFLMPIVSWCFAIFCAFYVISPVDIVPEAALGPFGLLDDIGAIIAAILAVKSSGRKG